MAGNNIDVTILSSQKGLCIAPGISPIVISDRLYEERVKIIILRIFTSISTNM